jgi:hypothetical protein
MRILGRTRGARMQRPLNAVASCRGLAHVVALGRQKPERATRESTCANRRWRADWATLVHKTRTLRRPLLPRPKCGYSLPPTLPTTPAALSLLDVYVVRCKQMTIAAGTCRCSREHRLAFARGTYAGEHTEAGRPLLPYQ